MTEYPTPDEMSNIDRLHLATGRVIRRWASLELLFAIYIARLLATDEFRGRIVWMSQSNISQRLRLVTRLGETFVNEAHLPAFLKLLKRASDLSKNRNMLAHSQINDERETNITFFSHSDDKQLGVNFFRTKQIALKDIESWATAIEILRADLQAWLKTQPKAYIQPKFLRDMQARSWPDPDEVSTDEIEHE